MIDVLTAGMRLSTATLLAGLGGHLSAITGQLNIAIEGMMLLGAYFALMTAYFTGSVAAGVIAAVAAGAATGLVLSVTTIRLQANIFVVGITLNILASGLTAFLLGVQLGTRGSFRDPSIGRIPNVTVPLLGDVPWLGDVVGRANLLTYVALMLFAVTWWITRHTTVGLHLRVSGEAPAALIAAGIAPDPLRIGAQIVGGGLCGLSGAYLSLAHLSLFTEGMSAGRGFLALAAVIFAGHHLTRLAMISIAFGVLEAWALDLQGSRIPPQIAQMLPYAATLAVLVTVALRTRVIDHRSRTLATAGDLTDS